MSLKSFLDRLLSGIQSPSDSSSPEDQSWDEKRRSNRVDVFPGDEIFLYLLGSEPDETGKRIAAQVRNVSLRGCRMVFKDSSAREGVRLGQMYVATLDVEEFSIPLQIEVIRLIGNEEVAVRFKPPFPRELERLEKFLEPRCLGMSMREIDPAKLKKQGQDLFHWFQGINETQLYCWMDSERSDIVQMQLIFLERVVEWKKDGGLATGRVKADAPSSEMKYGWAKAELLDFDSEVDPRVVSQATALVESMNKNKKIRDLVIQKLTQR